MLENGKRTHMRASFEHQYTSNQAHVSNGPCTPPPPALPYYYFLFLSCRVYNSHRFADMFTGQAAVFVAGLAVLVAPAVPPTAVPTATPTAAPTNVPTATACVADRFRGPITGTRGVDAGVLAKTGESSVAECAAKCKPVAACLSFSYRSDTGRCWTFDTASLADDALTTYSVNFAHYYEDPDCFAASAAAPTAVPTVSPTLAPTPLPCTTGEWRSPSECTHLCGGGTVVWTRDVTPEGSQCAPTTETRVCNTQACTPSPTAAGDAWQVLSAACGTADNPLCGYIYNFDECETASLVFKSCPSMCGVCGNTTTITTATTTTASSTTTSATATSTTTTRTSLPHNETCTDDDLCGTLFAYSECFSPVFSVVRDNCPNMCLTCGQESTVPEFRHPESTSTVAPPFDSKKGTTDSSSSAPTPAPTPLPPSPPGAPVQSCLICNKQNKNRPSSITFLYIAGQGQSSNNQGSKAYGALASTFPASATVTMNGQSKSVTDGDQFTIQGSFGADSTVSISGQTINFHTSCSVDLKTGDIYGPLTVLGGGGNVRVRCQSAPFRITSTANLEAALFTTTKNATTHSFRLFVTVAHCSATSVHRRWPT